MTEFARSKLDSVLLRALELSDDERERFLDETCDRDTDFRRAVNRLLESCADDEPLLQPGGGASGPLWEALAREYPPAAFVFEAGDRLGAWRIVRVLGRGGMATVYLAERADGQFEQSVAVKVLDVSRDFDALAVRFAQERHILASLEHPNIARLIDGGTTRTGQPYVVMEYVDGEAIDAYCDRRRLGVPERIELFEKVASAVQYAHGHLIVHRDIKPSNILVAAGGEPKLLDFGIAKLLDPLSSAYATPLTRSAIHPMTPEYASPEQVRGEPLTTASDVYQLGFLLYRMLTGRSPYSSDRRNVAATIQAICNVEPTRPSLSVFTTAADNGGTADNDVGEIAAARGTTAERLRRCLAGDLDNILLAALRKESGRRYQSAIHLHDDLRRYREGQPVTARPLTLRYRGGKFVRRHRASVAAALVIVLTLAGGLAGTAWQARVAAQEAAHAEQQAAIATAVMDYLTNDMIAAANPGEGGRTDVTVAELLDVAAESADERFAGQPEVEAAMRLSLGEAYIGLGDLDAAETQLAASLLLLEQNGDGSDTMAISARIHLADVLTYEGRLDEARTLFEDVVRIVALEDDAETWLHSQGRLAGLQRMQGDTAGSLQRLEQLLPQAIAKLGTGDQTTQQIQEMLANALSSSGRLEESLQLYRSALEAAVGRDGENHVAALRPRANLGTTLRRAGRLEEARAELESALEGYRAVLSDEHVQTLWAAYALGLVYADLQRYNDARELFQHVTTHRERLLGPEHPGTLSAQRELERVERASKDATAKPAD
jgi:serine/threonine-protein kinase